MACRWPARYRQAGRPKAGRLRGLPGTRQATDAWPAGTRQATGRPKAGRLRGLPVPGRPILKGTPRPAWYRGRPRKPAGRPAGLPIWKQAVYAACPGTRQAVYAACPVRGRPTAICPLKMKARIWPRSSFEVRRTGSVGSEGPNLRCLGEFGRRRFWISRCGISAAGRLLKHQEIAMIAIMTGRSGRVSNRMISALMQCIISACLPYAFVPMMMRGHPTTSHGSTNHLCALARSGGQSLVATPDRMGVNVSLSKLMSGLRPAPRQDVHVLSLSTPDLFMSPSSLSLGTCPPSHWIYIAS